MTKFEISARLHKLADEMFEISGEMMVYDGEWPQHAEELAGAAGIARGWAEYIETENDN